MTFSESKEPKGAIKAAEPTSEQELSPTISLYQTHAISPSSMIRPWQLRGARGLLDWTRTDVGEAARISPETVKNIEHGTFKPQDGTRDAILKAFTERNIEFIDFLGFQLKTVSGRCLGKAIHISGVVLITPIEQESCEPPINKERASNENMTAPKSSMRDEQSQQKGREGNMPLTRKSPYTRRRKLIQHMTKEIIKVITANGECEQEDLRGKFTLAQIRRHWNLAYGLASVALMNKGH